MCCFGPNALEGKLALLNRVTGAPPGKQWRSFVEYERNLLNAYGIRMIEFPPGGRQCWTERVCRNVLR